MSMTFQLQTFGCRLNQYETQAIREQLIRHGHREADALESADWVVINSCTVTESADAQIISKIRSLHSKNPKTKIAVAGCLVQQDSDLLKQLPGIRLLVGSNQKHRIAELIEEAPAWELEPRIERQMSQVYGPLSISEFEGRAKAFVKVQDGCDRACAFCKIPYVRGRSRSRLLSETVEEVQRLVEGGFQEVVLTGVAIGLWGREWNRPRQLADLVEAVDRLPGNFRIRLSSLDPRDLDERLIQVLEGSSRVCRHLHLSLQSGSDFILEKMNRGHTTDWYCKLVEQVRSFWPDLGLTTDLIVGFPGETEAQAKETDTFCLQMRFLKTHVFPYSSREKTSARSFRDHLDRSEVKRRARRLRETAAEAAAAAARSYIGTTQRLLVEKVKGGWIQGYTGSNLRVQARPPEPVIGATPELSETDFLGQLIQVRLTGTTPEGAEGLVLAPSGPPAEELHPGGSSG